MVQKIREFMKYNNLKAVLITKPQNIRYFSKFTGISSIVLITDVNRYIYTDFRYVEQAKEQCIGYDVVTIRGNFDIINHIKSLGLSRLAFEDDYISYSMYSMYKEKLEGVEFVPLKKQLTKIRAVKTELEIENISKASGILDETFSYILDIIKPGISEIEIANEIEYYVKKKGANGIPFETIVASGKRTSMPNAVASNKLIDSGDFLTMDFGCIYNGYCADITRTVFVGKASEKQKELYDIVFKAQTATMEAIKAGVSCRAIDKIARDIISAYGYADNFGHGLGHGVGLEVHELPRISSFSEDILEENMVITDEPGIYIPEFGGIRIEDLLVVTNDGYRLLSKASKELIEI
ncbi:MAG: M24 family metallopeptidase [Proteocatella sp.]